MAAEALYTLPTGYELLGTYKIHAAIGRGVSTLTYAASVDGRPVCVEEYYPARSAARVDDVAVAAAEPGHGAEFDAGLAAFLTGARALAGIRHDSIVDVVHWGAANGTGYLVTEDPEGETLADALARRRTLPDDELKELLAALIGGLEVAHLAGHLHRQINPAAIVVRADGTPVLHGFGPGAKVPGGARQAFGARAVNRADVAPGYTALEQYTNAGREGPWTDVYALGAVMYRSVLGTPPADAPYRAVRSDMPAAANAPGRDPRMLAAIDSALAVQIASRPQSLAVWRAMFFDVAAQTPHAARAGRTSARGFGRASTAGPAAQAAPVEARRTARATAEGGPGRRALRWTLPATAAVVMVAVMTWVDTGVLRGGKADAAAVAAATPRGLFADPLRSGGTGPAMVRLGPGRARLDCPTGDCGGEDGEVVLQRGFAMSKYEITNAEYAAFARATDRPAPERVANEPVVDVSWDDAAAYAAWLGTETGRAYRLPSEAEWEYAAQAGEPPTDREASATASGPRPSGAGVANAHGIHALAGNVSEWVANCAHAQGADGSCERRIRRGSSWMQPPPNAGAAARAESPADFRALDTGFRVAASES